MKKNSIKIKEVEIAITGVSEDDYISLTDIARIENNEFPSDFIKYLMQMKSTFNYLIPTYVSKKDK